MNVSLSKSLTMSQDYELISAAYDLVGDESEANTGYAKFLSCFGSMLTEEEIKDIKENMSDEINHSLKILAIIKRRSGIAPSSDGLKGFLTTLGQGVDKS